MFTNMTPVVFYLIVAVVLISAELIIMQFSVFWFLFFGIGALLAALVAWAVPGVGWYTATGIFLAGSVATAALLFPSLRKWQNKPSKLAGHDAIGQRVIVLDAVTEHAEGKVQWSGSDWPARLAIGADELEEGDTAVIKELEGIRLIVSK